MKSLGFSYLILFIVKIQTIFSLNIVDIKSLKSFVNNSTNFQELESIIFSGQMRGYLKTEEYEHILNLLTKEYLDFLTVEKIGKSFSGNYIFGIKFKINPNSHNGMLFTGIHHAREPVSLFMNLYIILNLVYELDKGNQEYWEMALTRNIYFIPLINVDGYNYNTLLYESVEGTDFGMVRKNRRTGSVFSKCNEVNSGVDLNRNYAFKFNYSEKGSSSDPCSETYRGEYPFSEPETSVVKNFIEQNTDIKIAYNYHTFGNYYIFPYCYVDDTFNYLLKNNTELYSFYEDFEKKANFPKYYIYSNSKQALNYPSNGDATDWMLAEKQIYSFSPELGNQDTRSETFYPKIEISTDICRENLNSAIYAIKKSSYSLILNNLNDAYYLNCIDLNKEENGNLNQDINLLYLDQRFSKACEKYENYFFSINKKIVNDGLEIFNNPNAVIKIKTKTSGINRIMGNLVKINQKNQTIFHNENFIDSDNKTEKIISYEISKQNYFDFNFTDFQIESNYTLLIDMKFLANETILSKISINIDIELIYSINQKIYRNIPLLTLLEKNFTLFDPKYNGLRVNADTYTIINNNCEIEKSEKKFNFLFLIIPIFFVLISATFYIFWKFVIVKKNKIQEIKKKDDNSKEIINIYKNNKDVSSNNKNLFNQSDKDREGAAPDVSQIMTRIPYVHNPNLNASERVEIITINNNNIL